MHDHKVVAKAGGKVVGEKVIKLADNLAEAVKIGGGEERVVALFNQQYATNTRNNMARPVSGSAISKKVERFNKCISVGIDRVKALLVAELTEAELKDALSAQKAA